MRRAALSRLVRPTIASLAVLAAGLLPVVLSPAAPAYAGPPLSNYDRAVLADSPRVFYRWANRTKWYDHAHGLNATFSYGGHGWTTTRAGDNIPLFNGVNQYAVVNDHQYFSVTTSGVLSIEAWIMPSRTTFADTEGSGYVHWSGKGERSGTTGNREWATRIYSQNNTEGRQNRISGYVFGPQGGLGAGSYFQDPISKNQWLHYTFVINTKDRSTAFPAGYTRIYRDGVLRMTASIAAYPNVVPKNGTAKLRIGTVDGRSFFAGAIGKYAIYGYELPSQRVAEHFKASPFCCC